MVRSFDEGAGQGQGQSVAAVGAGEQASPRMAGPQTKTPGTRPGVETVIVGF
jgi:hypothetical protein